MKKIGIDDLPFAGAELTEAELGDVSGGRPPADDGGMGPGWKVTWYRNGRPAEWEKA
ncbi:putative ATP-grasp target RiPP [Sphaerimonospora cavernae]|uniref:ATP-grasp target RiPP n=1 Tax=Sphaerimonospora cavernae TaxID=1740611 RepID=A0ABV6TX06_9ACTN